MYCRVGKPVEGSREPPYIIPWRSPPCGCRAPVSCAASTAVNARARQTLFSTLFPAHCPCPRRGRTADIQAAGGLVLLPWISDTFEQDPESGLANVILGPTSCALVFVMYLWHLRCQAAAAISCDRIRRSLSSSRVVVVLAFLACLFAHGFLGFKVFSNFHRGIANVVCAVCFGFCSWAQTAMVTAIEYRGDLASFPLTAARGVVSLLMLGCMVTCVATNLIWDCTWSHVTSFDGPDYSSTQFKGNVCVNPERSLAEPCLQRLLDPASLCFVGTHKV